MNPNSTILIDCRDEKGLIYKISNLFFSKGLNVVKNSEYVDASTGHFFMRSEVSGVLEGDALSTQLRAVLPEGSVVKIMAPKTKRVVLMGTKEAHCLGDLLLRHSEGEIDVQIAAVLSNYETLAPLCEKFDVDYRCISHADISREAHEASIIEAIDALGPIDYIVLAKYMRILTPQFVRHYLGKIINIHHSFLPAFIGANPYKQAFERGVKIIGATAHFVTDALDEGPIIAQDVIRVDHTYDWRAMQQAGRDVEKIVLARALKLALGDRIFVNENKTVIF